MSDQTTLAFRPTGTATEAGARVIFAGSGEFYAELRRRIDAYFQEPRHSRRDHPGMYVKAAAILAAFASSYVLLLVVGTWWLAVPLAILLGLTMAGIGFNLMHDGGHGAFSRFRAINRVMACSLDLVGGSSYIWHWKHGIFHHTYPNLTGHDSDVALGRLARLTPHQPLRAHQRWQHWYLWALYGFMAAKWHFYDDFRDLLVGRIGSHKIPRPKRLDLLVLIAGKVAFFTLAFGVPLLLYDWWVVFLFYGLVAMVLGLVLSIVFQLAHCVEEASFPGPAEANGRLSVSWAAHQVQTTVDFCRGNRVLSWFCGGLTHQIEHHLFPRICHANYPALAHLVKDTCLEFGLPYHEHPTFRAGLVSHYRWLRHMGDPATAS